MWSSTGTRARLTRLAGLPASGQNYEVDLLNTQRPDGATRSRTARRTGLSQSAAVEMAVAAKLAELQAVQRRSTRCAEVSMLLSELDMSLAERKYVDQQDLYDDHGLPV